MSTDMGEPPGQIMGLLGDRLGALVPGRDPEAFGENQVMVVTLSRRDRLVLAEEVTR
jgi:hypothetical protein